MLTLVALVMLAADPPKTFITSASGVRLRATAAADALEVTRLPICSQLKQLEAPGSKVTVGGQEGVWEHLTTTDAKQGFLFSTGLRAIDPGNPDDAYLALAAERAAKKDATFAERADLYGCLTRAAAESKDENRAAKLHLARLTVLRDTLALIQMNGHKQPFKGFLTQYKDDVSYSEPAGEWFAEVKPIWDAESKYHQTPTAEPLAWLAAETSLPGECEGYLGCRLSYARMSEGEYLKRHRAGAHVTDALERYASFKADGSAFIEELTADDLPTILQQVTESLALVNATADSPSRKRAVKAMTTLEAALKKAQKTAKPAPK